MRTFRQAQPALLLAFLLAACASPGASGQPAAPEVKPPTPPAEAKVDVRGRVTQYHRASGEGYVVAIQVEGSLETDTRYAKAEVHITRKSRIFIGAAHKPASSTYISIGDLVEVTFTGPVKSDPVQGDAAEVIVLEKVSSEE